MDMPEIAAVGFEPSRERYFIRTYGNLGIRFVLVFTRLVVIVGSQTSLWTDFHPLPSALSAHEGHTVITVASPSSSPVITTHPVAND
jgi:hypothetical protein